MMCVWSVIEVRLAFAQHYCCNSIANRRYVHYVQKITDLPYYYYDHNIVQGMYVCLQWSPCCDHQEEQGGSIYHHPSERDTDRLHLKTRTSLPHCASKVKHLVFEVQVYRIAPRLSAWVRSTRERTISVPKCHKHVE